MSTKFETGKFMIVSPNKNDFKNRYFILAENMAVFFKYKTLSLWSIFYFVITTANINDLTLSTFEIQLYKDSPLYFMENPSAY